MNNIVTVDGEKFVLVEAPEPQIETSVIGNLREENYLCGTGYKVDDPEKSLYEIDWILDLDKIETSDDPDDAEEWVEDWDIADVATQLEGI